MENTQELGEFGKAVLAQEARTENNMKAYASSLDSCVDLFFKIGASRGKNIIPDFMKAFVEDKDLAVRIALWSRDVRGGAGERKIFRDIIAHLCSTNQEVAQKLVHMVPELGRWDDMFSFTGEARKVAFGKIAAALNSGNGLCAKWMPRKGPEAAELRNSMLMSPKAYRKLLVGLTQVVETPMCANNWDSIEFEHVPSVASARYRKTFEKHTPVKFKEFVTAALKGDVKINAGAVYPYDVIKGFPRWDSASLSEDEQNHIIAQWNNLPNYVGDAVILPMVDVSGSMHCEVGDGRVRTKLTCVEVAVGLGLYLADKNTGPLKDIFMTFSAKPSLELLRGNVVQKVMQLKNAHWSMNTDLNSAFETLLNVAVSNKIPADKMPKMILILSDMQFDQCAEYDDSAMEMIRRKYKQSGYGMPAIVFWNLNARDNMPARADEHGVVLVSGFSPIIVKSILSANFTHISPKMVMLEAITNPRYDW